MTFKDHFKVGDRVKIGIHLNPKDVKFYESKILDIIFEKNVMIVYGITEHGKIINIKSQGEISVLKETGPLVFLFNTRGVNIDSHNISGIALKIPKEIERMQRRDFFRLPINVKISLKKEGDPKIHLGETSDLSGNGLSIDLDTELEKDDIVIMDLPLTDDIYISEVYGKVSRITEGVLLPYRYGIQFTDIDKDQREQIVSYIFQIQRMRIKIANEL